jgi:isopentenyl diphosphate isomerase/L-lactate dehydrogenase-like FMN-dependent dehydrogenase
MLRAQRAGGAEAVEAAVARIVRSIRAVCLLSGARTAGDLSRVPVHLGAPLRAFLDDLGVTARR